ncbi:acetate/propionate family kinase [Undibacterium griseum]|uniref:Acetate kinase n=1 Tax=Undibacterium griseum TaxID=2762295 RepID=A0ABR6YLB1_9BURK|nr:acetate/propionate family kinase [Undibacterium griseum]MBC3884604.1 acetate/propionate family kinase [Undibacterium griseum]
MTITHSITAERQPAILSVNSGSSTVKFALYPLHDQLVDAAVVSGVVEGLEPGGKPCICLSDQTGRQTFPLTTGVTGSDAFTAALTELRRLIASYGKDIDVTAIAHRVVHGGEQYAASVLIDRAAVSYLQTLNPLAPLHQPHNLEGILAFQRAYPDIPQIACFDTGFHAELPVCEKTLALPQSLRDAGIRRYGFHGLSYRYVAQRLAEYSSKAAQRVVMAHLGNGASACAMLQGKSVATTMGFSALDGLMMGTRCGALDPGVLLYLMQAGWDAARLEKTLYKESGLLGVSGLSADMRTLRQSGSPAAQAAIALFTYRVMRECAGLTACTGGLDVLAFTGGIGEHDTVLRGQVVEGLHYLGLKIDPEKNAAATGDQTMAIHAADSQVEIWVVPTDEGRIAAMDASAIIGPKRVCPA